MTKEELQRKLTPEELQLKMLETPVKDEPIGSGVQQGKRLWTYADGTQVIFKPASGEAGAVRSKPEEDPQ